MRGKGFQFNFEQSEHRITPAYAGKSYHVLLLVDEN